MIDKVLRVVKRGRIEARKGRKVELGLVQRNRIHTRIAQFIGIGKRISAG